MTYLTHQHLETVREADDGIKRGVSAANPGYVIGNHVEPAQRPTALDKKSGVTRLIRSNPERIRPVPGHERDRIPRVLYRRAAGRFAGWFWITHFPGFAALTRGFMPSSASRTVLETLMRQVCHYPRKASSWAYLWSPLRGLVVLGASSCRLLRGL